MDKNLQYSGNLVQHYSSEARTSHPHNSACYGTWRKTLCKGTMKYKNVLDLGCGNGHTTWLAGVWALEVLGVDISPEMIGHAKPKKNVSYVVGDARNLDLGRTFDIVTPTFLFNYAESIEELQAMMDTAARHLRSGGLMVALNAPTQPIVPRSVKGGHWSKWLDKPFEEGSRVELHVHRGYIETWWVPKEEVCSMVFRHWPKETYESCLKKAGFESISWVPVKMEDDDQGLRDYLRNPKMLERYCCSIVLTAIKK
jgi:toxoflavin synthase